MAFIAEKPTDDFEGGAALIGNMVPDFVLSKPDNTTVRLSTFLRKATLLVFWMPT